MKTLFLLGVGLYSPDTVKKLHEIGLKIVFVQRKELFDKEIAAYADEVIITDYRSPDFYKLANKLHEIWHFDAVLSLTEAGVEVAALLNKRWGFPGSDIASLEYLKNKGKMRELLNKNNFSKVKYAICNNVEELTEFIVTNGLPVIVKPIDAGGSLGISLVRSLYEVEDVLKQIKDYGFKAIVEEFIDGPEYSVESFSFDGKHNIITITEKQINEQFIEVGQIIPARLNKLQQKDVEIAVTQFLSLVGVTNGPCHTELKISPKGIRIIESHNRIGGDYICKLINIAYDVDIIKLSGLWACRLIEPMLLPIAAKTSVVVKFATFDSGKIAQIKGIEKVELDSDDTILDFKLYYGITDIIPKLISNSERSGHVIVHDIDPAKALNKAENIIQKLEVTYV